MLIRKATIEDLKELLAIYNYEVEYGTSTLDLTPKTLEERKEWFYQHGTKQHPLYVAEIDGHIAGYITLSPYREKEAYRSTVELSIYVAVEDRRKGVASALMEFALKEAKQNEEIHTIVSVITGENEASRKLHERFGFSFCGTIKEVGMKFGKYLDIDNYSLIFD